MKAFGFSTTLILSFIMIILVTSCEDKNVQTSTVDSKAVVTPSAQYRSISDAEYKSASPTERRIADQIDAAVNALSAMSRNNDFAGYEAVVSVSKNADDKFSNSILISASEDKNDSAARVAVVPDHKCEVCGMSSAYACIREIQQYMDSTHKDEIDIHIKRYTNKDGDDCVHVTY